MCAALVQGVANGSLTVGDTVLFVTLMQQLYAPLNYFGGCLQTQSFSQHADIAAR